jgi:hypothetical protein
VNSINVYRNGDFEADYTIVNKTLTFSYVFGNSVGAMGGEEIVVRYTI